MSTKQKSDPAIIRRLADAMRHFGEGCTYSQLKRFCCLTDADMNANADLARQKAERDAASALKPSREKAPPVNTGIKALPCAKTMARAESQPAA